MFCRWKGFKSGFLDVAGFDALGTNPQSDSPAVSDGSHLLKIGIPTGLGFIVSVAYIISYCRPFPAYIAYF
jgi:hypothetical protein